jgi:hypothetical protein
MCLLLPWEFGCAACAERRISDRRARARERKVATCKGKKFCEETTTADLFLFLTFGKRGAKKGYAKRLPNFGERRRCDRRLFVSLTAAA